jgi:hypothetical protein
MPKGVRRVMESAGAEAVDEPVQAVRSRDELEAERYTEDFLKRNRPNLTGFEQRLPSIPDRPGWVRRWANDMNSRVASLMERGWQIVKRGEVPDTTESVGRGNTDIGGQVSVVSTAGEGPMRVVLMEIPKKLFDMQMEAVLQPVRMTEQAIREGRNGLTDTAHVYTPKGVENRISSTV